MLEYSSQPTSLLGAIVVLTMTKIPLSPLTPQPLTVRVRKVEYLHLVVRVASALPNRELLEEVEIEPIRSEFPHLASSDSQIKVLTLTTNYSNLTSD